MIHGDVYAEQLEGDREDENEDEEYDEDNDVLAWAMNELRSANANNEGPDSDDGSEGEQIEEASSAGDVEEHVLAEVSASLGEVPCHGSAAPAAAAAAEVHAEAIQRGGPLDRWDLEDSFGGFFKYNNKAQNICAHCVWHGCRRTRSLVAGTRAGQGRPLGHLTAWLLEGANRTASEHQRFTPDLTERQDARAKLHEHGLQDLFRLERAAVGEEDSEPELVT